MRIKKIFQAVGKKVSGNNDWKKTLKKAGISLGIVAVTGCISLLSIPAVTVGDLKVLLIIPVLTALVDVLKHYN